MAATEFSLVPIEPEKEEEIFQPCPWCKGTGKTTTTKADLRKEALEVLYFLNVKLKRSYPSNASNVDLIVARLNEGFSVKQMKQVIVRKMREWHGNERMMPYLRPATLFGRSNFAQYVGELGADMGAK